MMIEKAIRLSRLVYRRGPRALPFTFRNLLKRVHVFGKPNDAPDK